MKKEDILDRVADLSADELVDVIQAGILTFDELLKESDGELSPTKRQDIHNRIVNGDKNAWNKVVANPTIEGAQDYLNKFQEGSYRNKARDLIVKLSQQLEIEQNQKRAIEEWNSLAKNDINALRLYVNKYPDSDFVSNARKLINDLQIEEIMGIDIDYLVSEIEQLSTQVGSTVDGKRLTRQGVVDKSVELIKRFIFEGKISKDNLLNKIKEDPNTLNQSIVKRLIDEGDILTEDLQNIGIDRRFIRELFKKQNVVVFEAPEKLDRIHKQSTEVYFWGIPSSGKSTALGAILSAAASGKIAKSMDADTGSQGYGYMTRLMNLFQPDEVTTLIASTAVDEFYEMGFDLVDENGRVHPITLIDMAGELMRCMYKHNAGEFLDEVDIEMLDTLNNVLIDNSSSSRKMHVFVIEYGAEDRLYDGLPQRAYLDGALSYIKNTGIFQRDTDAIYLMISKSDKIQNLTKQAMDDYIMDKYRGFYNGLTQICVDNEINRGKVEKIAFTLGQVCFQNFCIYNPRPAENIVKILLDRSASYRTGKFGSLLGTLRK